MYNLKVVLFSCEGGVSCLFSFVSKHFILAKLARSSARGAVFCKNKWQQVCLFPEISAVVLRNTAPREDKRNSLNFVNFSTN